jgi:hypothetical protein
MKPTIVNRRGRALASLSAVLGLGLAAAAVTTSPAQSVAPTGDCAVPFPVSDLTRDQPVHGLTVTSGTTPEPFTGSVIGVLEDGIGPDIDMIMVRLSSPELARVGGIWQGMSGSPVYAADGSLIGAVAYGLSWGPSPVAGVTPFASMDDYLAAPASTVSKVPVTARAARVIAQESDVTAAQAAQGFTEFEMPLGVSGVSGQRLARADKAGLREQHKWLQGGTYKMGAAAAAAGGGPGAETIVAGGNLAASLSSGDVTAAGVGTATSVCEGRVVGFGHPMIYSGDGSTLALHPADALYIQEESLGAPFKLANLGAPVGTITDDHTTGITGFFGALPASTEVTSVVGFAGRSRTGSTQVSVQDFLPDTAFYQNLLNHDAVIDGATEGSELQTWSITGNRNGTPFEFGSQNRYASDSDITWASAWQVADLAWMIGRVPGVTITDIDLASEVTRDSSTFELTRIEQRRGGSWTRVGGKSSPVIVKAGRALRMRAVLSDGTSTKVVPFGADIPAKSLGSMGRLFVSGGGSNDGFFFEDEGFFDGSPDSLASIEKLLASQVRNDQLSIVLALEGRRGSNIVRSKSEPQEKVVSGAKRVRVIVAR